MHRVALMLLHCGICLLLLGSFAVDAVIKARESLNGILFQHANSSSVDLEEHQSLYHVRGINVVLL